MSSNGAEIQQRMYVCSKHDRWVEISGPNGDTMRPCPECPRLLPAPKVLTKRPLTGLAA